MLLKSSMRGFEISQRVRKEGSKRECDVVQIWYSPYLGSLNSSIKSCMASADGRTKQRQRRCRIFSLSALSNRLRQTSAGSVNLPVCADSNDQLDEVYFVTEKG